MIGRGIRRGLGRVEGGGRCWGMKAVFGGGRGLDLGYWGEEAVVMVVGDCEYD